MFVSTGTRRGWPISSTGPLTDEYSLASDWDNQWLTGGTEADVIAEAHLDPDSIFAGIERFGPGPPRAYGPAAFHAGITRLAALLNPLPPYISVSSASGEMPNRSHASLRPSR